MGDFEKLFNDFFELGFGRPRNFYFNTKTKDMMPTFWEKTDDGYKCTCRTVGIAPSDVKISVGDDCIYVKGETEFDRFKYSTNYELPVSQDVLGNIKSVKYKSENGITVIYLEIVRPEIKKILIEQV